MKTRFLITAILSLGLAHAFAQITLGADWLLDVGFEMTLYGDNTFSDPNGNLARAGANQTWTFAGIQARDTTVVSAVQTSQATFGANFPGADFVLINETSSSDFPTGRATNELYMQQAGTDLVVIGIANASVGANLPPIAFTDPLTFQSTPIFFDAAGNDESRVRATFGPELLVQILGDSSLLALVDSVGFSLVQQIDFEVDAWGTVEVPGASYDALRMRTVNTSDQEIEVKVPFLGWIPIDDFLPNAGSIPGVGSFQATEYSWLVAEYSYPIITVSVDSTGAPNRIQMNEDLVTAVPTAPQIQEFTVRQSETKLFVDLASELIGQGELRIFGADGRVLHTQAIQLDRDQIELSTEQWPAGTQLVTVWQNQRPIATKRVITIH